ncbi:Hypothetical predicted protein [Marmota monax]|uniref:Uncharacterized protein n=1 Tax=Marmota monax TaxID=9995 RepID=A0A5E4CWT0_MARMO|nr:Hypothetical predicted protein [Marmota monax]
MMDMHEDNSHQSSLADASPIQQENSSNSSPAPEPNSTMPSGGTEAKVDEGKEHPGAKAASDEQNSVLDGKLDEQFRESRMAAVCRVGAGGRDVHDLSGFGRSATL